MAFWTSKLDSKLLDILDKLECQVPSMAYLYDPSNSYCGTSFWWEEGIILDNDKWYGHVQYEQDVEDGKQSALVNENFAIKNRATTEYIRSWVRDRVLPNVLSNKEKRESEIRRNSEELENMRKKYL